MKKHRISLNEARLHKIISESIGRVINDRIEETVSRLNESIPSNNLAAFFKEHGGVSREFPQDGLGDVSDKDILIWQEFPDHNSALMAMYRIKKPDYRHQRSKEDMRCLFQVYTANDGSALLVGLDRKTVPQGLTWGGETTKKVANRRMSNGWNRETGNRYRDDREYHYVSPAKDFGVYDNRDYKKTLSNLEDKKSRMSDDEYKEWRENELEDGRKYLQNYYPKQTKKLRKA